MRCRPWHHKLRRCSTITPHPRCPPSSVQFDEVSQNPDQLRQSDIFTLQPMQPPPTLRIGQDRGSWQGNGPVQGRAWPLGRLRPYPIPRGRSVFPVDWEDGPWPHSGSGTASVQRDLPLRQPLWRHPTGPGPHVSVHRQAVRLLASGGPRAAPDGAVPTAGVFLRWVYVYGLHQGHKRASI